ncbi:MAG: hypothetical protein ABJG78_09050 [Cyclobacteriaceae bacterium]
MRSIFTISIALLSLSSFAQEDQERLDDKIDAVTYDWDLEADKLATYEGLLSVCGDQEYRSKVINLLSSVHHLDSVLYDVLLKVSKTSDDKEVKKTLKDIKKFEEEYGTKQFIHFMNSECKAAREIERNSENTRNQVGAESYSGQVYLLETELFKYVKHVTQRVDKIRLHVHHLSRHYE